MNKLRHENIIKLIGVCLDPIAMVIELAPEGALDTFLHGYEPLSIKLMLRFAVDIARVFTYSFFDFFCVLLLWHLLIFLGIGIHAYFITTYRPSGYQVTQHSCHFARC